MKNLVIYAHPNPNSFNHAILETVVKNLKESKQEVEVRNLYELNLNSILKSDDFENIKNKTLPKDIEIEQQFLLWAERIIVIYPVWWASMPAILKGYVDRVFSKGFAYTNNIFKKEGFHLAGKEVYLFTTSGAPGFYYTLTGMFRAMNKTINGGIFKFCKMKVKKHVYFGGVPGAREITRKKYLEKVKKIILKLK